MTGIDTVVFDLGGVLIDWNPVYLYRKIFSEDDQMRYFLREVCSPEWNELQDGGRPLSEATEWLVERHPEYEAEIRAFYGRWEEMLGGAVQGTVGILERLHAQQSHRLFALTNWSAETFPVALDRYDFLGHFQGILVSGQEKLKKPDLRIYQLLADRFSIAPASALFIDDNARNVEAAQQVGFNTHHFVTPAQLEEFLTAQGILVL